jgi:hypothetical protein
VSPPRTPAATPHLLHADPSRSRVCVTPARHQLAGHARVYSWVEPRPLPARQCAFTRPRARVRSRAPPRRALPLLLALPPGPCSRWPSHPLPPHQPSHPRAPGPRVRAPPPWLPRAEPRAALAVARHNARAQPLCRLRAWAAAPPGPAPPGPARRPCAPAARTRRLPLLLPRPAHALPRAGARTPRSPARVAQRPSPASASREWAAAAPHAREPRRLSRSGPCLRSPERRLPLGPLLPMSADGRERESG